MMLSSNNDLKTIEIDGETLEQSLDDPNVYILEEDEAENAKSFLDDNGFNDWLTDTDGEVETGVQEDTNYKAIIPLDFEGEAYVRTGSRFDKEEGPDIEGEQYGESGVLTSTSPR